MIVESMITAMTDAIKHNLGRFCEKGDFSRLTPELAEAVTAAMKQALSLAGVAGYRAFPQSYEVNAASIEVEGESYRFKRPVEKKYLTPFGSMVLPRNLFWNKSDTRSYIPLEASWGMTGAFMTVEVREAVLFSSGFVTPEETQTLLEKSAWFQPSTTAIKDVLVAKNRLIVAHKDELDAAIHPCFANSPRGRRAGKVALWRWSIIQCRRNKGGTAMTDLELFRVRIALIQVFLRAHKYAGVLLSRPDNFAMATGGKRNYVSIATDVGACSLFVTREGKAYFVGNNIEETRVMAEELDGLGCEVRSFLWFDGAPADIVAKEFKGALVSDDGALGKNVNNELAYLRALLTPFELEKYRKLGQFGAHAMMRAVKGAQAGMTEADIAAKLVGAGAKDRCIVPVALVAADERIRRFRHPLPTRMPLVGWSTPETRARGYVMIAGCFLREGMVVSLTRFRQVGDIPSEVHDAYARICGIDALMQEASEPGKTLGDVFAVCQRAYKALGFPANEWHNHHQGGTTGYAGRTCKAVPGEPFPIRDETWARRTSEIMGTDIQFGHAFAWNPSAVGVKSEDTFILWPDGRKEIVTGTPQLPAVDLEAVLKRKTEVVKSGFAR